MEDAYIGIDIGSQSVRVSITTKNEILIINELPITIYKENDYITQDIQEIWNNIKLLIESNLNGLQNHGKDYSIKGIGCIATCSMVVLTKQQHNHLYQPYPINKSHDDIKQNIVMWMDTRSKFESVKIQNFLKNYKGSDKLINDSINCFSSGFSPELAIPKLKNLLNSIPEIDLPDIVVFDLHDYILYLLSTNNNNNNSKPILNNDTTKINYSLNQVGIDGSLKGWSKEFFNLLEMNSITTDNFKSIGRVENIPQSANETIPIPFAGEPIAFICQDLLQQWKLPLNSKIIIGSGLIDCYGCWLPCAYDNITNDDDKNPLVVIGGTSTCFLLTKDEHENENKTKKAPMGVWGPFNTIIPNKLFYEGGLSTSGILFENLFQTHKAFTEIKQISEKEQKKEKSTPFQIINELLDNNNYQKPVEYSLNLKNFYYGDLSGNRTPYNEPEMKGMYIGETLNHDLQDFLTRYLSILEFIAFETKKFIILNSKICKIDEIIITGSQALNFKLCELISIVCELPVYTPLTKPNYSGVIGAAMLGIIANDKLSNTITITKLVGKKQLQIDLNSKRSKLINKIMISKFEIYNKMIDLQLLSIRKMSNIIN